MTIIRAWVANCSTAPVRGTAAGHARLRGRYRERAVLWRRQIGLAAMRYGGCGRGAARRAVSDARDSPVEASADVRAGFSKTGADEEGDCRARSRVSAGGGHGSGGGVGYQAAMACLREAQRPGSARSWVT